MEPAVIVAFVVFLLVNLGLGLYQGRHVRTASEYILGRGFTTSMLLLTLTGTLIGADYLTNWFRAGSHWGGGSLFLWTFVIVSTGLLLTFYIFPKLRSFKGWYTLGDIVRQAYGSVYAQVVVDGISLLSSVILLSAQLVALKRVTSFLDLDSVGQDSAMAKYAPYLLIVVFTLVVIAYASRAGTLGVVSTDVLQMIFVLGGTAFIAYKILYLNLGDVHIRGLADLWQSVKAVAGKNPLRYFFKEDPALARVLLSAPAAGLILLSPAFIKRVGMASDNRQLTHSMLGFVMLFSMFMLMILIGGYGLYVVHGKVVSHDDVYTTLLKVIPNQVWMRVLLLIMFLAAVMSTADSILTASAVLGVRISMCLRNKQLANSAIRIGSLRVANVVVGFLALSLALLFIQRPVIDFVTFARAILGGLVPCLLGISLGVKKSSKALLASIACFFAFWVSSMVLGEVIDFSFLDPRWTHPKFPLRLKYGPFLPLITFLSCLAYLLFEAIVHGGLKWEDRARFIEHKAGPLQRAWWELKSFSGSPLIWAEEKVDSYDSRPVLLALFCIMTFLSGHLVGRPLAEEYIKSMTVVMLGVFSLCALLLTHEQWYKLPKHYFALFWLFSVVFCLPFAFLLRWFYHPTFFNAFYLLLVPFVMYALLGGNLGVILSLVGYVMAFGVWRFTLEPGVVDSDRMLTLLGLGFTTLFAQILLSYPIDRSLEKTKRPKLWASAWGHDLSHLFMETQMEVDEKFNPLPKEKEERLKAYAKRMSAVAKHVQSATSQSQAFRQLIIQDNIRPSEIVSMPLAEVVKHVYATLKSDFQDMVRIKGKGDVKVRVFLPIFTNILTNLIRNAWKAGATNIEITWDEEGPVLYIRDNGAGISKEKLASLFEHSASREGKGIGLPFIKEALAKMGALIDVESGSEGSVFMILLERG